MNRLGNRFGEFGRAVAASPGWLLRLTLVFLLLVIDISLGPLPLPPLGLLVALGYVSLVPTGGWLLILLTFLYTVVSGVVFYLFLPPLLLGAIALSRRAMTLEGFGAVVMAMVIGGLGTVAMSLIGLHRFELGREAIAVFLAAVILTGLMVKIGQAFERSGYEILPR